MAHQRDHEMSMGFKDDALKRIRSVGDPYSALVDDGNFRASLLKALDAGIIIAGTNLEVSLDMQARLNGSNHRRLRDRAKTAAVPLIGGASGVGLLVYIRDILQMLGA